MKQEGGVSRPSRNTVLILLIILKKKRLYPFSMEKKNIKLNAVWACSMWNNKSIIMERKISPKDASAPFKIHKSYADLWQEITFKLNAKIDFCSDCFFYWAKRDAKAWSGFHGKESYSPLILYSIHMHNREGGGWVLHTASSISYALITCVTLWWKLFTLSKSSFCLSVLCLLIPVLLLFSL